MRSWFLSIHQLQPVHLTDGLPARAGHAAGLRRKLVPRPGNLLLELLKSSSKPLYLCIARRELSVCLVDHIPEFECGGIVTALEPPLRNQIPRDVRVRRMTPPEQLSFLWTIYVCQRN